MKLYFSRPFFFLILSGIIIELFLVTFLIYNGDGNIPLYMFIYFETFLVFFFALYIISGIRRGKYNIKIKENSRSWLLNFFSKLILFRGNPDQLKIPLLILLFGIVFRLTLIPSFPTTSDDLYRYIWEGKLIVNGYNPFAHPPEDELLNHLKDDKIYENVTFKYLPAIYPPVSQISFALAYLISGENFWGLKLLYLLCEIFTLIFLLKIFLLKRKDPNYLLLYAWLPLPVMEFFVNIHLDPLGIMFMIIFIYFVEKKNYNISAIFLALAFLSKFYPAILFPLLIKRAGLKKFINFTLIFLIISALFYAPFIYKGVQPFEALFTYLTRWEFNGPVFKSLKYLLQNNQLSRIICGASAIILIGIISVYYKNFIKASFWVFITFIISSATIYPWYLGWAAVLNPFVSAASAMSLFFTINVSNVTPMGEVWQEYWWVYLAEYFTFFTFLLWDWITIKRRKAEKKYLNEIYSAGFNKKKLL